MGGQNCHLDVNFTDGTTWLARIRFEDSPLPPEQTRAYVFASEIATLKFLEKTSVPAPKVYTYATKSRTKSVGLSYMLVEKLPGAPLQWSEATSEQRSNVMHQLADIFLELEKYPFPMSGSLTCSGDDDNVFKVSGFANPDFFSNPDQTLGPFETVESSFNAMISQQQDQLLIGELSFLREDQYLSQCYRRDMIQHMAKHCEAAGAGFYLTHAEPKGDHILVDADFNITGIIDWEFATLEPKALAFSSPCMLWPVGKFFEGNNDLSSDELEFAQIFERCGRADLGQVVREGRKMQRSVYFNGGMRWPCREKFEGMFDGLRAAFFNEGEEEGAPRGTGPYEDWKNDAKERYKHDEGLQALLRSMQNEGS